MKRQTGFVALIALGISVPLVAHYYARRIPPRPLIPVGPQVGGPPPLSSPEGRGTLRKPHMAPKPGEVRTLTIKELGNFDYVPASGQGIPADVLALNGMKVRLRGYMIPMDQAERLSRFALVPSRFGCCYGQPPTVQHTVIVDCPAGDTVSYDPDPISVEGVLAVKELKMDEYVVSLFHVACTGIGPGTTP